MTFASAIKSAMKQHGEARKDYPFKNDDYQYFLTTGNSPEIQGFGERLKQSISKAFSVGNSANHPSLAAMSMGAGGMGVGLGLIVGAPEIAAGFALGAAGGVAIAAAAKVGKVGVEFFKSLSADKASASEIGAAMKAYATEQGHSVGYNSSLSKSQFDKMVAGGSLQPLERKTGPSLG